MENFVISLNAMKNLISTYASHKRQCAEIESEYDFDWTELGDDVDYQFHLACCQTAEDWMRVCGISPDSNFVRSFVEKER